MNSPADRRVVFHADDLGMNAAVTDGVMDGFRRGLLTSSSLMSNAPDADRALDLWKKLIAEQAADQLPSSAARSRLDDPFSSFDLGVHLNLTKGRPMSGRDFPYELLDEAGRFPGIFSLFYRLQKPGARWRQAVYSELALQIEFLLDRGLQPTHLNGHQYIEMMPTVTSVLPELLDRYKIRVVRAAVERLPFRSALFGGVSFHAWSLARVKQAFARRFRNRMDRLSVRHPDGYHGTIHAGRINMEVMRLFLDDEPPFDLLEIGMHPSGEISPVGISLVGDCPDFRVNENGTVPFKAASSPKTPAGKDDGWDDSLAYSRPNELRLLTSPELADYLESRHFRLGRLAQLVERD